MSQLINIKPTIENCDPFKKYQQYAPGEYSLQEVPLLYGGGRKWILKASDVSALKYIALAHQKPTEVDLFVLNTSFIVWLNDYNKGIEIPYHSIDAQTVQRNHLGIMCLKIQVKNTGLFQKNDNYGEDQMTELVFTPMYGESERYYNEFVEQLFTFEYFGINKGERMVTNTFYALRKCSSFHFLDSTVGQDDFNEEDSGSDLNAYEDGYDNSGSADDIGMDYEVEDGEEFGHAGINVKIFDEFQRGVTRSREDLGPELGSCQDQRRESPKRIRCS